MAADYILVEKIDINGELVSTETDVNGDTVNSLNAGRLLRTSRYSSQEAYDNGEAPESVVIRYEVTTDSMNEALNN